MTKPYLIGIGGGSASGKTTLTHALAHCLSQPSTHDKALTVETLSLDSFVRQDKTTGPTFISPSTGEACFNWNHPDALDLPHLLSFIETRLTADDAPDALILEGLMTLQIPQLREICDLRLFVELDADERALRRLLRDMQGGRTSTDPHFIATYYRESARVGHALYVEPSRVYADLIIRGDADATRVLPLLAAIIAGQRNGIIDLG